MYLSLIAIVLIFHLSTAPGRDLEISKVTRPACAAGEHNHRCAHLRIRAVRVERVDDCGFEYADLEDNSVGVPNGNDHRWDYAKKFEMSRFTGNQVEWQGRQAVKPGMLGMAIYCSFQGCGRVIILQLIKPELLLLKPANK